MSLIEKIIGGGAFAVAATLVLAGSAYADVCDTPSRLGKIGKFEGEVITMAGSMQGKDEANLLATASCFEKATGAVVKYSGSRDFAALIVADLQSGNAPIIAIFHQPGGRGALHRIFRRGAVGDARGV